MLKRCSWVNENNPAYIKYHDEEWGKVIDDDNKLFEVLSLEIFQTGLSWEIVLNKRDALKKSFNDFIPDILITYNNDKISSLIQDKSIIRHKLKINSIINNAKVFLVIKKEFGSFRDYVYMFDDENELLKDLKARGMSFIGKSTIKSFMEAIGIINSHDLECFKHNL